MFNLKVQEKSNPFYLPTNGSLYTGEEESTARGEKSLQPPQNSKYSPIWKRAKNKIIGQLRIKKLVANAKNLGIRDSSNRDSINTLEIEKFLKKNIKNLSEESKKPKKKPSCCRPFSPDSRFRNIWDGYLSFWLLYSCIVTPINLAFFSPEPGDALFVIDMIIDFSFLIDVILNFHTGYYDKEGAVQFDRWKIAKNYLMTWFLLDAVAAFPSGLVEIGIGSESKYSRYNDIVRVVKLRNIIRLLKVTRAVKFFKYSQKESLLSSIQNFFRISHSTRRLITTLLMIIISIHIFACFFYYANVYNDFSPDSWAVRYGIRDSPIFDIYLSSVYYSVVTITTIGYGDITPKTKMEKCLAMGWMIVAVYFLSFVISSLSSSLAQNDVKRALMEQKLALLDSFGEEVGIDKVTKKKIQDEIRMKIMRSTYSSSLKSEVIQDLSSELKHTIATKMYNGIFRVFKFFSNKDQIFISSIFPLLEAHHFIHNEVIYSEDDFPDYIYFIGRGRVSFMVSGTKHPFSVQNSGNYFGEIEIVRNTKRMFSVISPKESFLLGMGIPLISRIREEFSKVWDEVQTEAETRLQKIIKSLAEMKVLLKLNTSGMIGNIKSKEVKISINEEIRTITLEFNKKNDHSEMNELIELVKKEILVNKETLNRIEHRVKKMQKKEKHRFRKNRVLLPPIKGK